MVKFKCLVIEILVFVRFIHIKRENIMLFSCSFRNINVCMKHLIFKAFSFEQIFIYEYQQVNVNSHLYDYHSACIHENQHRTKSEYIAQILHLNTFVIAQNIDFIQNYIIESNLNITDMSGEPS